MVYIFNLALIFDMSHNANNEFVAKLQTYQVQNIRIITNTYLVHWSLVFTTLCPVRYDPRYITKEQGQMLIVPHVRESDNGEYCCLANNGIGESAKSCGALQLKMSMSVLIRASRAECADGTIQNVIPQKRQRVEGAASYFVRLRVRTSDQTPSHQPDASGGIQSGVALRDARESQTRCHLDQRWWAH